MNSKLPTVLVIDDEPRSLETLRRTLEEEFEVLTAESAEQAEQILELERIQAILCDQRMPGESGVEFLSRVRERWPEVIRIIISGYTDAGDLVEAINQAGIYQYISKPWHPEKLLLKLRNAIDLFHLQRQNSLLASELRLSSDTLADDLKEKRERLQQTYNANDGIVRSDSSPMNEICEMIGRVAPYDVNVLISGESGTGKELVARAIHYNSTRRDGPFVAENCGAMPDELLESELFGHKRGAFTGASEERIGLFELADGGTVFLDEIGEISPAFQVKLLRVLQEGEVRPVGSNKRRSVNVRVVAATNRDLEAEVRAGNFRQDLYYRIATFTIGLPPLRERKNDIALLAHNLLQGLQKQLGKDARGVSREAIDCLENYHWPGNVRELQNELKRMLVLAQGDELGADLLSPHILQGAQEEQTEDMSIIRQTEGSLKERLDALEARIIKETLIRHRWNKTRASEELGLSRVGLRSKLERYGLEKIDGMESLEARTRS